MKKIKGTIPLIGYELYSGMVHLEKMDRRKKRRAKWMFYEGKKQARRF